jgi:hypothetical protein
MRLCIALRAFFRALFDAAVARRIEAVLDEVEPHCETAAEAKIASAEPRGGIPRGRPRASRSDAITLLATLQREARLVDFFMENLESYSDAQIGAAARDVHRDAAASIKRLFGLEAVVEGPEGRELQVPEGFDAGCYRLTGNVSGEPPFQGTMVHHGWRATKCELPAWSGGAAADIVAPAEVELK